jgi:Fe2+ transport system protein FeoA
MTLESLRHGIRYVIDAVDCTDPVVQRLMVLGLVEGAQIELVSIAIGGDPLEFRVHGVSISLRLEQARFFSVSPANVS